MNSDSTLPVPDGPLPVDELHRFVGAIVAATTHLEFGLSHTVTSLTRSPLTLLLVQGERASTLIRMCKRLIERGLAMTAEEERAGKTPSFAMIDSKEAQEFVQLLKRIESLVGDRDHIVHSLWLPSEDAAGFAGHKITRSSQDVRMWNRERLQQLRQDLEDAATDLFIATQNATRPADAARLPTRRDVAAGGGEATTEDHGGPPGSIRP